MQFISSGTDTINLGAGVDLPLDNTTTNIINTTDRPMYLTAMIHLTGLEVGSTLTYTVKIGAMAATTKTVFGNRNLAPDGKGNFTAAFLTDNTTVKILLEGIVLSNGGTFDTLEIYIISDDGADDTIDCTVVIYNLSVMDSDGRVNVGKFYDETVSLTNNRPDVNAQEVGGTTPLSDVGTETKQDLIIQLQEADTIIDATAGTLTFYIKGTATEILKKNLKQPDDSAVSSPEHRIAAEEDTAIS